MIASLIISMTKFILDADWLRGVQLMIFPNAKTIKMAERYLSTNKIALEKLKAKELNENTNKSVKFWLKVWQGWALAREYDVEIENYSVL